MKESEKSIIFCNLRSGGAVFNRKTGKLRLFSPGDGGPQRTVLLTGEPAKEFAQRLIENGGAIRTDVADWLLLSQALEDKGFCEVLVFGRNRVTFVGNLRPAVLPANGAEGPDFSLNNQSPPSVDFAIQARKGQGVVLGINVARNDFQFPPGQPSDFRECFEFLRVALAGLNREEAERLVNLCGLHVETKTTIIPETKKGPGLVFERRESLNRLRLIVLQEILNKGGNFESLLRNKKIKKIFPAGISPAKEKATVRCFSRVFYFWTAMFHLLFPQEHFPTEAGFYQGATFRWAKESAQMVLERTMTALKMAQFISENSDDLRAVGISPSQQKLWASSLLGREGDFFRKRGLRLTTGKKEKVEEFRRSVGHVPSPLERLFRRWLFSGVSLDDLSRAANDLIVYLSEVEQRRDRESLRHTLADAVGWLRQRRESDELGEVLAKIQKRAGKPIAEILGRESRYSCQDYNDVLCPLLEMLASKLEGIPPEKIFTKTIDKAAVKRLYALAIANFRKNKALFNPCALKALGEVGQKLTLQDFSLPQKNVLTLIYIASRQPFQPEVFWDAFHIAGDRKKE